MDHNRVNQIFRSSRPKSIIFKLVVLLCFATSAFALVSSERTVFKLRSLAGTSLACPADITQPTEANSCSRRITYSTPPPTSGGTVSCLPASGSAFAVGTTIVTCKETDAGGTVVDECRFNVKIEDREQPVFSCPPQTQANASANCQAAVPDLLNGLTVTDNCTAPNQIVLTQNPAAGTLVGKGNNNIEVVARDAAGNERHCNSIFRVVDITGPTISGLVDQAQNNTQGECAALLAYTLPTAIDSCDGPKPVNCTPANGERLAVGTHTVRCSARDDSANETTGTFTVTIKDNERPVIDCPLEIPNLFSSIPQGAVAIFGPPAVKDNCGVNPPECDRPSGTIFPIGSTNNRCVVKDIHNNQSECTFAINVIAPKFSFKAINQTTGDFFQLVSCTQIQAHYGYWEYHKAATASSPEEVYYGYANSIRTNGLGVTIVEDKASKDYELNATLNPYSGIATVEVTILASSTKRKLVTTKYETKDCEQLNPTSALVQ